MTDSFSLEPYFRPRYSLEAYFRGGNILWSGSFVSISSNVFAPLLSRRQTANFEETKIRATFVVNTFIGIPLQHVVGPLQINWHILNDQGFGDTFNKVLAGKLNSSKGGLNCP